MRNAASTKAPKVPGGEILVYEAPDGGAQVEVRLAEETVWRSLKQISGLFGRDQSVISRHLRNIFTSGELERRAVVAKNATTATDGEKRLPARGARGRQAAGGARAMKFPPAPRR